MDSTTTFPILEQFSGKGGAKMMHSDENTLYNGDIKNAYLDQIIIADRIYSLISNDKTPIKKVAEKAVESLAKRLISGYDRHSLAFLCTYGDPIELFQGDIEIYKNSVKKPIDLFGDDSEVKENLKALRNEEGLISLVINEGKGEKGKYMIQHNGIYLPDGNWQAVVNHHHLDKLEELSKKLGNSIGNRLKAMLNFSINHLDVWFLKVNGKEPYLIQKGNYRGL